MTVPFLGHPVVTLEDRGDFGQGSNRKILLPVPLYKKWTFEETLDDNFDAISYTIS